MALGAEVLTRHWTGARFIIIVIIITIAFIYSMYLYVAYVYLWGSCETWHMCGNQWTA